MIIDWLVEVLETGSGAGHFEITVLANPPPTYTSIGEQQSIEGVRMHGFRKSLFFPVMLMFAGVAVFFLYLYAIGLDPDENDLSLTEWMIGGMLIGPGFGYLIRWRRMKDLEKKAK